MLSLFATLIGLVPGLESLAASWHASALEAKVKMTMAQLGCSRDVAVATIQAQAQVQTRWWFVAAIPPLWALPFVLYTWKAIAWDNVVCPFRLVGPATCNTEPLGGVMSTMLLMIVSFYFLHGMKGSTNGST